MRRRGIKTIKLGSQAESFVKWMMSKKSWNIAGGTWTLELGSFKDPKQCGECNFAKETIKIRKDMGMMMQARTFAHESDHAAGGDERSANHAEMLMVVLLTNMD